MDPDFHQFRGFSLADEMADEIADEMTDFSPSKLLLGRNDA